jgi:hypothetical protein
LNSEILKDMGIKSRLGGMKEERSVPSVFERIGWGNEVLISCLESERRTLHNSSSKWGASSTRNSFIIRTIKQINKMKFISLILILTLSYSQSQSLSIRINIYICVVYCSVSVCGDEINSNKSSTQYLFLVFWWKWLHFSYNEPLLYKEREEQSIV